MHKITTFQTLKTNMLNRNFCTQFLMLLAFFLIFEVNTLILTSKLLNMICFKSVSLCFHFRVWIFFHSLKHFANEDMPANCSCNKKGHLVSLINEVPIVWKTVSAKIDNN